jgi:hypothetical protein
MRTALFVCAFATGLIACASSKRLYDGPARPPQEVAAFVVDASGSPRLIVNGTEVRGYSFEILPADTTIEFGTRRSGIGGRQMLWDLEVRCSAKFVAHAGQHYRIALGHDDGVESRYIGTKSDPDFLDQPVEGKHVYERTYAFDGWIKHIESGSYVIANCNSE